MVSDEVAVITVKLPISMVKELDRIAELRNTNRSEIIREAIDRYLARKNYKRIIVKRVIVE